MDNTEDSYSKHLKWCKDRANAYLDAGDWMNAWASFTSDMSKNAETANHSAIELGMMLLMAGHNKNVMDMRKFIDGFN